MTKKGEQNSLGLVLGLVILAIVVLLLSIGIYRSWKGFSSSTECEKNGGTCQATCLESQQQLFGFECKNQDVCCKEKGTNATSTANSTQSTTPADLIINLYTKSGTTFEQTIPASEDVEETYFGQAQGERVGVCILSILEEKDGALQVFENKRVFLGRNECLRFGTEKKRVSFTPTYEQISSKNKFYLQFIVLDESIATEYDGGADWQAGGALYVQAFNNANWADSRLLPLTITEKPCDQVAGVDCVGREACVHCESTGECFDLQPLFSDNVAMCNEQCFGYNYDYNRQVCTAEALP